MIQSMIQEHRLERLTKITRTQHEANVWYQHRDLRTFGLSLTTPTTRYGWVWVTCTLQSVAIDTEAEFLTFLTKSIM